ncbi:MAG: acetyltransferase [Acidobacteria bacterium]|nr:acetyltransferase [Acidobacteriota bacterium]
MRAVVLVGAGSHGRGTLEILRARAAGGLPVPEVLGFVDDAPGAAGGALGGLPVLGDVAWLCARAAEGLGAILALASPKAKRALAERLDAAGVAWATAVHPSAIVGAGTTIAPGAIVGAGVVTAYDNRIGPHTTINLGATVGHDCEIGAYATIAPGVNITGNVKIGEGAEVQTNATIVPGRSIGAWSRVGPGAVVLHDVAEDEFVFGNPARRMPAIEK